MNDNQRLGGQHTHERTQTHKLQTRERTQTTVMGDGPIGQSICRGLVNKRPHVCQVYLPSRAAAGPSPAGVSLEQLGWGRALSPLVGRTR